MITIEIQITEGKAGIVVDTYGRDGNEHNPTTEPERGCARYLRNALKLALSAVGSTEISRSLAEEIKKEPAEVSRDELKNRAKEEKHALPLN